MGRACPMSLVQACSEQCLSGPDRHTGACRRHTLVRNGAVTFLARDFLSIEEKEASDCAQKQIPMYIS